VPVSHLRSHTDGDIGDKRAVLLQTEQNLAQAPFGLDLGYAGSDLGLLGLVSDRHDGPGKQQRDDSEHQPTHVSLLAI
jgi:hypothetical protein